VRPVSEGPVDAATRRWSCAEVRRDIGAALLMFTMPSLLLILPAIGFWAIDDQHQLTPQHFVVITRADSISYQHSRSPKPCALQCLPERLHLFI
jgi:hypothetical protein